MCPYCGIDSVIGESSGYPITREFMEVDDKRLLTLRGTVYVSGLGGDRLRDGSYEYYISEPRAVNNHLGIGAFMMAATEMERAMMHSLQSYKHCISTHSV